MRDFTSMRPLSTNGGRGGFMTGLSRLGRWTEIERRGQIWLGNFDSDLGWIDSGAAVDPVGHGARPKDDDDHQNDLQHHPGNGAPINFRGLDRPWCDAAQIKQGEAEWRMHEARLNIGADQHAEPDKIDAELVGDG